MSILKLLTYPHPLLQRRSEEVVEIDNAIKRLIKDIAETMYFNKGVGLAAPQVGVSKRIITVDAGNGLLCLLNPLIVDREGEIEMEEGCLSCPEVILKIKRSRKVTIKGLNPEGKEVVIEASELLARIFQHEIDHLDGILIFDRVSSLKKEIIKKRLKKRKLTVRQ